MMKLGRAIAILSLLLLLPVAHAGVEVEYDEAVDFSKYETYMWQKGLPAARPEVQEWIVTAVRRELRARGLRQITEGEPDLLVATAAFAKYDGGVSGGFLYAQSWDVGIIISDIHNTAQGTLVVDLVDAEAGELVWRAIAREAVSGKPQKLEKKIDRVVKKIFRRYPASSSK
jgi:hypothetical protein